MSRVDRAHFEKIRVARREGVSVVTTVLSGTSKREVLEAVPMEAHDEAAKPDE